MKLSRLLITRWLQERGYVVSGNKAFRSQDWQHVDDYYIYAVDELSGCPEDVRRAAYILYLTYRY